MNRTIHTKIADTISLSFSQRLVNIVWLAVQSHIAVPFKASDNIQYWKYGSRNWISKENYEYKIVFETSSTAEIWFWTIKHTILTNLLL